MGRVPEKSGIRFLRRIFHMDNSDTVIKFIPSLNNVKKMMAEKLKLEDVSGGWKPKKKIIPDATSIEINRLFNEHAYRRE